MILTHEMSLKTAITSQSCRCSFKVLVTLHLTQLDISSLQHFSILMSIEDSVSAPLLRKLSVALLLGQLETLINQLLLTYGSVLSCQVRFACILQLSRYFHLTSVAWMQTMGQLQLFPSLSLQAAQT